MVPQCAWQDSCPKEAMWIIADEPSVITAKRYKPSCDAHLGEYVRLAAADWVGCWVEKA